VKAIDPAGEELPLAISGEVVTAFSRLRSMKISPTMSPKRVHVNYTSWLTQCCPQPFLQTVEAGTNERVRYPANSENTCPVIRYAFQTVPGVGNSGLSIGTFKIDARVSVRGRRGVPLPPTYYLSNLSFAE
jgi:hypothetical protein